MKNIRRIEIRPAVPSDALMMASVLVETWRSTFRGLISDAYLDAMTVEDQAIRHARRMRVAGVFHTVAVEMATKKVIGLASYGRARSMPPAFDRELYTLYLLEEFQGAGIGSALVRTIGGHCRQMGASSLFAWVLAGNPNRVFYERLGARAVGQGRVSVGGESHDQVAYRWDDLAALAGAGTVAM
ncbi:GNAT family N-acetyltransferase [Sinorhizobium numidicum]|uniref:GNAT family N-acetyltransferase n=1 Tax=Sinorhizobium numidicum TaxID=680248 RepID=A0ABY8D2J1_9HYPH|nr:GNAT family N-acetyltransferase [Sinorhizobium numidicum]WEX79085.1 GNAT family N-acetyltransferase [Sinorhizobium numidicum]WEX85110.1 GNAT family N-acetyltransferase [Sinorhizobium numidicum]